MERFLSSNARSESGTVDERSRTVDLRTALLGAGALAAGYLLGRSLRSASVRERAGAALPGNGVDVPIVGSGESDAEVAGTDPTLEEVDERTEGGVEGATGGELAGDLEESDAEDTDEGVETVGGDLESVEEERAEEDIEEEPAEPGEMHVDEELAEEVLDEEEDES